MSLARNLPVKFLPLGAIIQEFMIGGRNVVLGFPKQQHYQTVQHPYFGETIGRLPNRLSEGKIYDLNGRTYVFAKNERGVTTLHGGINGWGKKIWNGPETVVCGGKTVTQFTLESPDGDEGFPGDVQARAWYGVDQQDGHAHGGGSRQEEVTLDIEYEAELVGPDADITETVCSMTNHSYWNITDGPTIAGTEITFATDLVLEVDENQIPTGRMSTCPEITRGEPILFTEKSPRIDDCFVLDTDVADLPSDTRDKTLRKCVSMYHPETKIHLELETTEPSFQFYSGDGIDVEAVIDAAVPARGCRSGIAVESNRYVNAANRPEWRSMVRLKRGQVWGCRNRFTLWRNESRPSPMYVHFDLVSLYKL